MSRSFGAISVYILMVCYFLPATAQVLPEGARGMRVDLGYSTAEGLWKGDEFSDFAGDGRTEDFAASYTSFFGLGNDLQLDLNIQFRQRRYASGDPEVGGTIEAGDEHNSINNVGVRLNRQLLQAEGFSFVGFLGVRAPGDDKRTGNFLDGTDGVTKYDIGFRADNTFGVVSTSLGVNYVHRPGEHDDQVLVDLAVPISMGSWFFGPLAAWQQTFSGTDIGDTRFTDSSLNQYRDFSLTKEQFTLAGLFAGFSLTDRSSIDFNLTSKFEGRNTDKASAIGIGYTCYY